MRFYLLIAVFWMGTNAYAQTILDWPDLTEGISWARPFPKTSMPEFQKATFSAKMKALEGKRIMLTGYLLVLDGQQTVYLLSKNPMASCFFCGNGGPETVVDLQFAEKQSFEMDDLLSIEGTLYLNEDDPNACYYRIEEAQGISFK